MDEELKKLRKEIDQIDREILASVEKRIETAGRIGALKKKKDLPIPILPGRKRSWTMPRRAPNWTKSS